MSGTITAKKAKFHRDKSEFYYGKFPEGFMFGCSSAAAQIEGGWDADGRGPSVWDEACHTRPACIFDGSNADVACGSYYHYKEDVEALKKLGANTYRFSISWSRVLPKGTTDQVNPHGVAYYNNLITELLNAGITPIVTIFHWDLPQALGEKYNWADEEMIDLFAAYARFCFTTFGDRVKYWLTVNEPYIYALMAFDVAWSPPFMKDARKFYMCVHNLIKAHAVAYRLYDADFRETQMGKIGLTADCWGFVTQDENSLADDDAAHLAFEFKFGQVVHPLFHGCYPPLMREAVDRKSKEEGLETSRLPHFDSKWSNIVKGSVDFIGLNHYTCETVTTRGNMPAGLKRSNFSPAEIGWDNDQDIDRYYDPSWEGNPPFYNTPWALRPLLNYIKQEYNNPEVIICENGCAGPNDVKEDAARVSYFQNYLNGVLKAVALDGCNVKGYLAWSLLDSWEWIFGQGHGFGVYHIDFKDPNLPRTQKDSAKALTKIFSANGFYK